MHDLCIARVSVWYRCEHHIHKYIYIVCMMGPQHLPSCHYFIPHTIGLHHGTRKTHYIFTILLVMKMQSNFMPRIEIKSTYHSAPVKKNRKILFWLGIIFFLALSVCANVFQDKFDMRRAFETYFIVCVNYTAAAWVFLVEQESMSFALLLRILHI